MRTEFSRVLALFAVAALVATANDAHARGSRRGSAPQQSETVDKRDNNTLCNGGMMIPADDQIRGCTALITTRRLSREAKATALYNRGNGHVARNDFARAIADYTDALAL